MNMYYQNEVVNNDNDNDNDKATGSTGPTGPTGPTGHTGSTGKNVVISTSCHKQLIMPSDETLLTECLNKCYEKKGTYYDASLLGMNIYIMVRINKGVFRKVLGGKSYATLDIVQLGWEPYLFRDFEIEEKPKNVFSSGWNIIEKWCKQRNVSIYMEFVSSDALRASLKKRGFIECYNEPFSLLNPLSTAFDW